MEINNIQQLYESQYISISYIEKYKFTELIWLPDSKKITREEYKQEMLICVDNFTKLDRIGHITDKRDCGFVVSPDLQEWVNEHVLAPYLKSGQTKFAIVEGNNMIVNLSSEQIMEEEVGEKFDTKYFDNIEDARRWLESFS